MKRLLLGLLTTIGLCLPSYSQTITSPPPYYAMIGYDSNGAPHYVSTDLSGALAAEGAGNPKTVTSGYIPPIAMVGMGTDSQWHYVLTDVNGVVQTNGAATGGPSGSTTFTGGAVAGATSFANLTSINALPISGWKSTAKPWFRNALRSLHNAANGTFSIVVFGDSRSVVDSTISAGASSSISVEFHKRWVDLVGSTLSSIYGSHGSGLVPLFWAAGNGSPNVSLNADYYTSGTALSQDCALGPNQGGGLPYCGVAVIPSGASVNFSYASNYDRLRAYCETKPSNGTLTMTVDGSSVGTACGTTTSNPTAHVVTSSNFSQSASHTASIACSGGSPCYLYGLEAVNGTHGVSVHNLSCGSCALGTFAANPAVNGAFIDLIPEGHDLSIIHHLTNEPGVGESTDLFNTEITNLVAHERGLSSAPSILLVSPGQDSISGQTPYFPVLAAAAVTLNTGFVDMKWRWGNNLDTTYFGPDQAHENNLGHAETADMILQTLDAGLSGGGNGGSLNLPATPTFVGIDLSSNSAVAAVNWLGINAGGTNFSYTMGVWPAGNGAGLSNGGMGLIRNETGIFGIYYNSTGDICFLDPVSGGNVDTCAGAKARINHDGTVTGFGGSGGGLTTFAGITLQNDSGVAAVNWTAPPQGGNPFTYTQGAWPAGNGAGLASGGMGLIRNETAMFGWYYTSAGDMCFLNPVSGGNVDNCSGSVAAIFHDGTVRGFGSSSGGSSGFIPGIPTATSANTTVDFGAGWQREDTGFLIGYSGGAVSAGTEFLHINFGKTWRNRANTDVLNPSCTVSPTLGNGLRVTESGAESTYIAFKALDDVPADGTTHFWMVTCNGPWEQ